MRLTRAVERSPATTAVAIALTSLVVGPLLAVATASPGGALFLVGAAWNLGAMTSFAVLASHRRPAGSRSGVRRAALFVSVCLLLLGLAAWAALATWGCLSNPHAPWGCPVGN